MRRPLPTLPAPRAPRRGHGEGLLGAAALLAVLFVLFDLLVRF